MLVKDIMVSPVISVLEDTNLEEIAKIMVKKRIGCIPVVNAQSELMGIITENEFTSSEEKFPFCRYYAPKLFGKWLTRENLDEMYAAARNICARDIMNKYPVTVDMDDSLYELLNKMMDQSVDRVPVLNGRRLEGIVTRHDLLKMIVRDI